MNKVDNQISESEFLQQYIQNAPHMMWFLGAGSSRSAGLPTATDIIWDLKCRYYCQHENQIIQSHDINNQAIKNKIQSYMDSKGCPALWSPEEYSFYFDLLFGTDDKIQQRYIHETFASEKVSLNLGHRAMAGLMEIGKVRVVFTTNFDDVIETAFAEVTGKNLQAFHIEGSYAALDALNADQFPLYAKIHGDFRYRSIKNLTKDLLSNDKEIQRCLVAAAARFGMVVTGYSGRDHSVMSMFYEAINQNNAFPHGLFWTTTNLSTVNQDVQNLISYAKEKGISAHIVETGTFDEMLSKIWRQTTEKPKSLDDKVRTANVSGVSIPLPSAGNQFPILRTNAHPILSTPSCCGAVKLENSITFSELREKIHEQLPKAILTYTGDVLFWGNKVEVKKVFPLANPNTIMSFDLENGGKLVSESTIMKSFFEEALAMALCSGKPLFLRRKGRTFYAVVIHDKTNDVLFSELRNILGYQGKQGFISGNVPVLKDVTWAECVSIRLEERGGKIWVMFWPDIWIKPLARRKEARDFLRKRRLYRYNSKSYQLMDAWINILLGEVGSGSIATVSCFPDTDYSAEFEIGTRTAFSRGGSGAN